MCRPLRFLVLQLWILWCPWLEAYAMPHKDNPFGTPVPVVQPRELHAKADIPNISTTLPPTVVWLKEQLRAPSGILAVLLIVGGDTIRVALAQASADRYWYLPTPVAFSFGWVSYSFATLLTAFGDGRLLPQPDVSSVVAFVGGQTKNNESWVLGRLVRDLGLQHPRRPQGLRIVFYKTKGNSSEPTLDQIWIWWGLILLAQFGIALVPHVKHQNWSILLITGMGTFLAWCTGYLSQWKREKFLNVRKRTPREDRYILTRGNSHSHAFVIRIQACHEFVILDHLAVPRVNSGLWTRVATAALSLAWVFLLIIVGGTIQDTWYLIGVGLLGQLQNVIAAGVRRSSDAHGIPLQADDTIREAMETLQSKETNEENMRNTTGAKHPPDEERRFYRQIFQSTGFDRTTTPEHSPLDRFMIHTRRSALKMQQFKAPYIDGDRVERVLKAAEDLVPGTGLGLLDLFFPVGINRLPPDRKRYWEEAKKKDAEKIERQARKKAEEEAAAYQKDSGDSEDSNDNKKFMPETSSNPNGNALYIPRVLPDGDQYGSWIKFLEGDQPWGIVQTSGQSLECGINAIHISLRALANARGFEYPEKSKVREAIQTVRQAIMKEKNEKPMENNFADNELADGLMKLGPYKLRIIKENDNHKYQLTWVTDKDAPERIEVPILHSTNPDHWSGIGPNSIRPLRLAEVVVDK